MNLSRINNLNLQMHPFLNNTYNALTSYISDNHSERKPDRERQVVHDQQQNGIHGVGGEQSTVSARVFS